MLSSLDHQAAGCHPRTVICLEELCGISGFDQMALFIMKRTGCHDSALHISRLRLLNYFWLLYFMDFRKTTLCLHQRIMDSSPKKRSSITRSRSSCFHLLCSKPAVSRINALGQNHHLVLLPIPSAGSPARFAQIPLRNT